MSENAKAFLVAMVLCLIVILPFLISSISFQPIHESIAAQKIPTQETTAQATANSSTGDNLLMANTPDEDRQAFWSRVYLGATAFGLCIAFLGLLASYMTNEYGGRISASQKVLIAQANARALEAKAELEKYKAPRALTGEEIESVATKLRPFAGQGYDLTVPDMIEPGSPLETQIVFALCKAGWKIVPFNGSGPTRMDERIGFFAVPLPPAVDGKILTPSPVKVGVSDATIGVLAGFEDGDRLQAHGELLAALTAAGISSVHIVRLSSGPWPSGLIPLKQGETIVHLIIGRKN